MKIISGIITSLLLALGMLVVAAPAQADPYPASVATNCVASGVRPTFSNKAYIRTHYRLTTNNGGFPDARVAINIRNTKTGQLRRAQTRHYTQNGTANWKFGKLPVGRYVFRYVANPDNDRYKGCVTKHVIRVTKAR